LAKLGGKVITRTSARPLIVGDNPNGVQSRPNFAKPPGRYLQAADSAAGKWKIGKIMKAKPENQSEKSCIFAALKT